MSANPTAAGLAFFALSVLCQSANAAPAAGPQLQALRPPLVFEPAPAGGTYEARAPGHTVRIQKDAVFVALTRRNRQETRSSILRMRFAGGNAAEVEGLSPLSSHSNYFVGSPQRWRTQVRHFGRVIQRGVYPGVDVVYYGAGPHLEFDLVVAPNADTRRIAMRWENASALRVDRDGGVLLSTPAGELRQHAPVVYQDGPDGRRTVQARYRMEGDTVRLDLGDYDSNRKLVIDPVLSYSTYLGGINDDVGAAIATDSAKNVYVCGATESVNFPTEFAPIAYAGGRDAFVLKLNPAGTTLLYSTFVGGEGLDQCRGVAVDLEGSAYLMGDTRSAVFPRVNAIDSTLSGLSDLFVAKLSVDGGALLYSTYLGGSGPENAPTGNGIAVDDRGYAYVGGSSSSNDFPTTAGVFQPAFRGDVDGVIAKLDPSGSALAFSTYLGGTSGDVVDAIAIDGVGNVYATGVTFSANFPITTGAFDNSLGGTFDAYVVKLNATGSALSYSTFLGGATIDLGYGITVDALGRAYVTGVTDSAQSFPLTSGAYDTFANGQFDVFVAKVNSDGSALLFSTLLGGGGNDFGRGIAVDSAGNVIVAGGTQSFDFPVTSEAVDASPGGLDGFVAVLDASGATLRYATLFGGNSSDFLSHIVVDADSDVHFTGQSEGGIPSAAGYDASHNGGNDGFAAKLSAFNLPACAAIPMTKNTQAPVGGQQASYVVAGVPAGGCTWTAMSGHPGVVSIASPSTGTGTGTVTYTMLSNATANARFVSIATGDWLFNIEQAGNPAVQIFSDVPVNHPFFVPILAMQQRAITIGCGGGAFCPSEPVTRGQMAAFLMRTIAGGDNFPFPAVQRFGDVGPSHAFYRHIQMMAVLGITVGCGNNNFCPDEVVTRGQMAAFVVRALSGNRFRIPSTPIFDDAPADHPFFRFIQAMGQRGVTVGVSTNPPLFGPNSPVTREQMAAFLMRAFAVK